MKQILIIDDDMDMCNLLSRFLNRKGFETDTAFTGSKGLVKFREKKYDVVLSDFRLGEERNGLDVIAMVRATARREIPACLMSGDTDATLILAAKEAGLTLLHKPVRPAKLRSLLRRLAMAAVPVVDEM